MATERRQLVTLGMFIIDEFTYLNEDGSPTERASSSQIGGGGTYATIGARIWLPSSKLGMIVDRGHDFPEDIERKLDSYGREMWFYRDDPSRGTTRALNEYRGEFRGFQYLTPRVRITPKDLANTPYERPATLHFICSPARAATILSEVRAVEGWSPITIYEPIPDRCVPAELPALIKILPEVSILSPNADEALSLLSIAGPPTKSRVEQACRQFLDLYVGPHGTGAVIIRSGHLGAYVATRNQPGRWIPAFWGPESAEKVVDVTGAGNAFLGGLSAGMLLAKDDVFEAALYATVSASFTIEQDSLPNLTRHPDGKETWNNDVPQDRLQKLRSRLSGVSF
ncbi:Ribokinase-like protein [Cytidiella melzeri]|nr:Ribokinase-like protein [Cytidiella melzeri]